MKTLNYYSECKAKFNTKIMRSIASLTSHYERALPKGWRAIVEIQRSGNKEPYYKLDVCSEETAGAAAPGKMQALKALPDRSHTGYAELDILRADLHTLGLHENEPELFAEICRCGCIHDIPIALYQRVEDALGISIWYGGIRVPYDILVTDRNTKSVQGPKSIKRTTGEIRVTFSGAKEWQDTFFTFAILSDIQQVMQKTWKRDQITFDTSALENGDAHVAFYSRAIPLMHCPRR